MQCNAVIKSGRNHKDQLSYLSFSLRFSYFYMDSLLATLSSWLSDRDNRVLLWQAAATTSVIYLALVRYLRYRYINELRRKYPDPTIALKDPAVAEEVFDITARREFPCMLY